MLQTTQAMLATTTVFHELVECVAELQSYVQNTAWPGDKLLLPFTDFLRSLSHLCATLKQAVQTGSDNATLSDIAVQLKEFGVASSAWISASYEQSMHIEHVDASVRQTFVSCEEEQKAYLLEVMRQLVEIEQAISEGNFWLVSKSQIPRCLVNADSASCAAASCSRLAVGIVCRSQRRYAITKLLQSVAAALASFMAYQEVATLYELPDISLVLAIACFAGGMGLPAWQFLKLWKTGRSIRAYQLGLNSIQASFAR